MRPISKVTYIGGIVGCASLAVLGVFTCATMCVIGAFQSNQRLVQLGLSGFYPALTPFIVVVLLELRLLYKFWSAIQRGRPRTTPGRAIGFLFIPFFDAYWVFQAYYGWAVDYNNYVEERKIPAPLMDENIALWLCISRLSGWLVPFLGPLASLVLMFLFLNSGCDCYNTLAELRVTQRTHAD